MALAPGSSLGPYAILALIGAGGMGAVYRARDSRLGRDVAIKVVADDGASDPVRRARFEQEARAAAALNHPHILAVHDIGTAEVAGVPTPYVVSELLEGETLRERLARGKLPVRVATELAMQIARGLAAAHEHGIVHRDIKPENVFVTKDGTAKVLDFGLAKLRDAGGPAGDADTTAEARVGTGPGVVLGTVGYMAPEQVRAGTVDHRADLFALGCVLYELLGGQRAFHGASGVETLHAILNSEPPDLTTLVPGLSGGLERIVRRCLEKDPLQRFQSARDLAFALEAVSETRSSSAEVAAAPTGPQAGGRWRERLGWVATAAVGLAWLSTSRGPAPPPATPPAPVMRFVVNSSEAAPAGAGGPLPRVSPDGRTVVYRAFTQGVARLHAWSASSGSSTPLPGTDGAFAPSWSHDGRHLYFRVGTALRRTTLEPGAVPAPVPFNELPVGGNVSLSSNAAGALLIVDGRQRLFLGQSTGSTTRQIDLRIPGATGIAHAEFLPDGRWYLVTTTPPEQAGLYLAALGSPGAQLVQAGIGGRVAFVSPDIVLYRRGTTLLAQRLDIGRVSMRGVAATITPAVAANSWSATSSSVAFSQAGQGSRQFVWRDRSGREQPLGPPARSATFDLSNDGRAIVASQVDDLGQSLWAIDTELGGSTKLTTGADQEADPRWSGDGRQVLFGSARAAGRSPYVLTLGASTATQLFSFPGALFSLDDWSRDGRWMIYHDANLPELYARRVEPDAVPIVIARSLSGTIDQAQVSPDSSVVAFNASDGGRFEVYVTPLREGGERIRISRDGGVQPTWRADGRELYFLRLDGTLMAVPVTPGASPVFGTPQPLFRLGSGQIASGNIETYLPAPDGRRFLALQTVGEAAPTSFTVIVNWQQLLAQAVAAP